MALASAAAVEASRRLVNESWTAEGGFTPLHFASQAGNTPLCQLLVRCGADVEARNAAGATALQMACRAGHSDTALFLKTAGGSIEGVSTATYPRVAGFPPRFLQTVREERGDTVAACCCSCSCVLLFFVFFFFFVSHLTLHPSPLSPLSPSSDGL